MGMRVPYLDNCNCHWETHGLEEAESRVYELMNQHQEERKRILKEALKKLS